MSSEVPDNLKPLIDGLTEHAADADNEGFFGSANLMRDAAHTIRHLLESHLSAEAHLAAVLPQLRDVAAERDSAQAEAKELLAQAAKLVEALAVYADPGFYHACSFMFDRPTGGFDEDFEYSEEYRRLMPGKTARAAIAALQPGARDD